MSLTKIQRVRFIAVFMGLMLVLAIALGSVIYLRGKAELERECMVYLLDIHNHSNSANTASGEMTALLTPSQDMPGYPPHFVLELSGFGQQVDVVFGDFFLSQNGLTPETLALRMAGSVEETGILEEYQVRYFNGVRQSGTHRISFIDISYIDNSLRSLSLKILMFGLPSLAILFVVALFLSRWFTKPLEEAMQEQRRFISAASHELKTPVSIISANMDLLSEVNDLTDPNYDFCQENIRLECQRMQGLVEAMLWLSLPGQKKEKAPETVNYSEIFDRELLRFEVMAYEKGLRLYHERDEEISLRGDPVQLARVTDVLVENALKYCQAGGDIRVTARKRGAQGLCLMVASLGEAIPREIREDIFKPFYQLDSTRKGAGLGLSIAHEIITAMNGSIRTEYREGYNFFLVDI